MRKPTILVASHDPQLADVRKKLLEGAGYEVVAALDIRAVEDACRTGKVSLVMIGYSVPAVEKRRIWALAKQFCETTPILELHYGEPPILTDIHTHQAYTAEDFITAIDSILKKSA